MNHEPYRQLLRTRIDEVLHFLWDPIGVSEAPSARDEYSTYADKVWAMVLEGAAESEISDYLTEIRVKVIGLDPHKDDDDYIAALVTEWNEYLSDRANHL